MRKVARTKEHALVQEENKWDVQPAIDENRDFKKNRNSVYSIGDYNKYA